MFQPQMPMPMPMMMQRTQGILQSPATVTDISNPTFQQQQQQQSRSIPFQVSFNGRKSGEQVATPFNGGGLVPITEKLLDSNSEQLPSSVGNIKRDSSMLDNNVQSAQSSSSPTPPPTESLPPFLQGAPIEIIEEFKRILRQPQLSYDEKVQQVQALILTLSPDRQQLYNQFMGQQNQQTSSTLSPASPQLLHRQPTRPPSRMPQRSPSLNKSNDDGFSKITRILQDESIPEDERWKQIVGIYGEKVEPRVKSENPFAFEGGLL
uniref:Uncharacterized protein n=1 Tax=Panagrolaimus sp. ES5 TaxID=591445 RepID=A0AC34FD45_9BILA